MIYESIFAQLLMGAAALIAFLSALSLTGAVIQYIQAKAAKLKAEAAMLLAAIKQVRPGGNGSKPGA